MKVVPSKVKRLLVQEDVFSKTDLSQFCGEKMKFNYFILFYEMLPFVGVNSSINDFENLVLNFKKVVLKCSNQF